MQCNVVVAEGQRHLLHVDSAWQHLSIENMRRTSGDLPLGDMPLGVLIQAARIHHNVLDLCSFTCSLSSLAALWQCLHQNTCTTADNCCQCMPSRCTLFACQSNLISSCLHTSTVCLHTFVNGVMLRNRLVCHRKHQVPTSPQQGATSLHRLL